MNLEISAIEFSDEVRAMANNLSPSPKPVPAVYAIKSSGLNLDTARVYARRIPVDLDRLNYYLAIEQASQKALADAGVVDDATAISYLNRVRPIVEGWAAQLAELQDRYMEELRVLEDGWVDL